jgi:Pyruvate/2-oxoacid:ferredoxin oxidoreductase gamma subunit
MNNKSQDNVLKFEPGKKRKLKDVDYVSPEKKELLRKRERQKKLGESRYRSIVLVGIFLGLVALVAVVDLLLGR